MGNDHYDVIDASFWQILAMVNVTSEFSSKNIVRTS